MEELTIGERVVLDKDFAEPLEVTIVKFTTNRVLAVVQDEDGAKWYTMTKRLSKLIKS
jgi:hypothetical protein